MWDHINFTQHQPQLAVIFDLTVLTYTCGTYVEFRQRLQVSGCVRNIVFVFLFAIFWSNQCIYSKGYAQVILINFMSIYIILIYTCARFNGTSWEYMKLKGSFLKTANFILILKFKINEKVKIKLKGNMKVNLLVKVTKKLEIEIHIETVIDI